MVKNITMPKKPVNKKEELTENYQYNGDGELIMDRPSEPLVVDESAIENEAETTQVKDAEPVDKQDYIEDNKTFFNKLVYSGHPFYINYMGEIIFDSDKDRLSDLYFDDFNFHCKGATNTYGGLSFKFKKI